MSDFKDFHKVKNMLFNVSKLKKGLEEVLKIENYDSANGIPNFAAICLNQVPGDPASTKGNNAIIGIFLSNALSINFSNLSTECL